MPTLAWAWRKSRKKPLHAHASVGMAPNFPQQKLATTEDTSFFADFTYLAKSAGLNLTNGTKKTAQEAGFVRIGGLPIPGNWI